MKWYAGNHRKLPWRQSNDPYRIWLSEVILQQTRVGQGLPYYLRLVRQFPTVQALAGASQREVLRCWQGLGYYTRARNMHACAKKVAGAHGGEFPNTYDGLMALPGIGSYTAAAIASIAFHRAVAVVDGNVYRVLSRIFGIKADISRAQGKNQFSRKANELIPGHDPGTYNQSIMEFGALHCTPKNPRCGSCPFGKECFANQHGMQDALPFKSQKIKIKKRYFTYFVITSRGKIALRIRNQQDIWQGLFDFYAIETTRPGNPASLMKTDAFLQLILGESGPIAVSKPVKHVLTHQVITARFVAVPFGGNPNKNKLLQEQGLRFYTARQIEQLPKPTIVTRFLAKVPLA